MNLVAELWDGIGGDPEALEPLEAIPRASGALPSSFAVEAFGTAAFATVGLAIAELTGATGVWLDGEGIANALRSEQALRIGDEPPESVWDPLSAVFPAADGWVRLHGNYAQHRDAIARVFGTTDPAEVAAAIAARPAHEVEERLHEAGGVAAAALSLEAWAQHPHGAQVQDRDLVATTVRDDLADRPWRPSPLALVSDHDEAADGRAPRPASGFAALAALASTPPDTRPLAGLRVLELTRVIAGPVAGRTLSWFGADVLRIESPDHHELRTVLVDTGPGKRSITLDLTTIHGRDTFEELLAGADVFLHGLRPGALQGLGLDSGRLAALSPGLIDASVSAYGPGGPWSGRRGFDSLMQLSTGLALAEGEAAGLAEPRALPCQLLDHTTGLLLAAAIIRAAGERAVDGRRRLVVASLARTAAALAESGRPRFDGTAPTPPAPGSLTLDGPYGTTHHVPFPVEIDDVDAGWRAGPPALGAGDAVWR